MKTNRRWLKSVLAASTQPVTGLPFQRQSRRTPEPLKPAPKAARIATAAR